MQLDGGSFFFIMNIFCSLFFLLLFLAEPKFTIAPVPKITAFTEQVTEIKCAVEGFPTPKIEWRRQGNKELPRGRHYIYNNNLFLRNPIKEDEDIYMCHAETPVGSVMGGTEVTVLTYGECAFLLPFHNCSLNIHTKSSSELLFHTCLNDLTEAHEVNNQIPAAQS